MSSTTIIGVCLCFRGCVRLQDDFTATSAQDKIGLLLPSGRADTGGFDRCAYDDFVTLQESCLRCAPAVLSDMAHNFTGISALDHERQLALARDALNFSKQVIPTASMCLFESTG
jgi:23S rRNA U2552 (ribose-2'-O)-methylase RlmE/FtsJ